MKQIVAFQGVPGAYSQSASHHMFGEECETLPCKRFEEVYEAVLSGRATVGAIPIENSTTGSIHPNFDFLLHYPVHIVAELKLHIEHALLAPVGVSLEQLTGVRSHPQALAQCSRFFAEHPQIREIADFDTAGSAQICAEEKGTIGAIASPFAGRTYGLQILKTNLENNPGTNLTRFYGIAAEPLQGEQKKSKCSIALMPNVDRAGLLYEALGAFAKRKLDLTKIESRPRPGRPWEYVFLLDFRGDSRSREVQETLEELTSAGSKVRLLGCYAEGIDAWVK